MHQQGQHFSAYLQRFRQIIFSDSANKNVFAKSYSLYKGLFKWGIPYKVLQRTYKFTAQSYMEPFTRDYLKNTLWDTKPWSAFWSGGLVGIGEAFCVVPLDIYKIRTQVNTPCETKKSFFAECYPSLLYRGLTVTILRNFFGSSIYFGIPEIVKQSYFGLLPQNKPTTFQTLVAAFAGSIPSIILMNPFDVIKTRVQASATPISALAITKEILSKERLSAFYQGGTFSKGFVTLMSTQVVKLAFSMTATQKISDYVSQSSLFSQPNFTFFAKKPACHSEEPEANREFNKKL